MWSKSFLFMKGKMLCRMFLTTRCMCRPSVSTKTTLIALHRYQGLKAAASWSSPLMVYPLSQCDCRLVCVVFIQIYW